MHSIHSYVSLEDLEKLARRTKSRGKKVVLCHGTFDLTHVGHIRHLQRASREGDVLFVTITGDKFVNKGPERPVFNQDMRAEALAALQCVDNVAVHNGVNGVEVIEAIRPDVYVKGNDYAKASDDITGNIGREEKAVLAVGGRIFFTDEVTFSSSSLLNEHFGVFSPETRQYLKNFSSRYSTESIIDSVRSLRGLRVCVVGDAIIDEYHYTCPLGPPGKGHALAVQFESAEQFAGGAIAVANHIGGFCDHVTLLTSIGQRDGREHFIRSHLEKSVEPLLLASKRSGTLIKRRYVDSDLTRLFEVYLREGDDSDPDIDERATRWLEKHIGDYDLVVVPDFGNGFISESMVNVLCHKARFLAVNTQLNSGNRGFHAINRYSRATFVSLNEPELRIAAHNRTDPIDVVAEVVAAKVEAQAIAVTMGVNGLQLHDRRQREQVNVPALSTKVVDRIGAGDAFLSLASMCMAGGLRPELTAFVGSAAAALDVQIVCNRDAVGPVKLFKYITTLLK